MAQAQGSPWSWGSTGDAPLGPESETWLCLAKALVAHILLFFFFSCYSCEPEMLSLGFLWHCGGGIVVAIVGIARDKRLFSLLKAFNQHND